MSSKPFFLLFCLVFVLVLSEAYAGLTNFRTCDQLASYYKAQALLRVDPYGLPSESFRSTMQFDFVSQEEKLPVPGRDFSETNVQVDGVDEPDIVKTDGKRVYVLQDDHFYVLNVAKEGASGNQGASLKLPGFASEMLFNGDHVLAIGQDLGYLIPGTRKGVEEKFGGATLDLPFMQTITVVYHINVAGAKPTLVATLRVEGYYVNAREVDGIVRLVTSANPSGQIRFVYPGKNLSDKEAKIRNKQIIRETTYTSWVPRYYFKQTNGKEAKGFLSTCDNFFHPGGAFTGFDSLSVTTLPITGPIQPGNSVSIAADGQNVYATAKSLYVASVDFRADFIGHEGESGSGAKFTTSMHKFSLTGTEAKYEASGDVMGSLLNQFSMHENNGVFFVATTLGAPWWKDRDTRVSKIYALKPMGGKLKKIGEVGNLGVGERIYAVRYMADIAYVVTFRQVDPLYIINLSNPTAMKVTGELKIPGYSSYLHSIGSGRLIGVGQEVNKKGVTMGAKVSLFDVSDVTEPKEIVTWQMGGAYTEVEWDHRAFLYWEPEKIAVLPVSVYGKKESFFGSVVLEVYGDKILERGRIVHPMCCGKHASVQPIERNFVLGGVHLWSKSYQQIQINDIQSLEPKKVIRLRTNGN